MTTLNSRASTEEAAASGRPVLDRVLARPGLWVFFVALVVRASAAVAIYLLWGGLVFGDEGMYSEMATAVVQGETVTWDEYTNELYWRTATWTLPLTALYALLVPNILLGQLLAAIAGAAAAGMTAALAGRWLPPVWALAAGTAVAFFPSQILWSALTLKDAAVWAVAVLAGLAIASIPGGTGWRRFRWVATLLVALTAMAFLRSHIFVVVTWASALAIAVLDTATVARRTLSAAALLVGLPWLLGFGPAATGFFLQEVDSVESRRIANAAGAATAIIGPDPLPSAPTGSGSEPQRRTPGDTPTEGVTAPSSETPTEGATPPSGGEDRPDSPTAAEPEPLGTDISYLPRGAVVMLLEPLPGSIRGNPRVRLAALEHLVWYPLLLLALAGVPSTWRARRVLAYPLLTGGATVIVYGLAEGNFGTAYRHRGELVWVAALMAAFGAHRLWLAYRVRQEQQP